MRQFIFVLFILLVACDESSQDGSVDSMDADSSNETDSGNPNDTGEHADSSHSNDSDSMPEYVEPVEPEGDECNTTAECQTIYGDESDDCADSGSDTSRCMCGDVECWTLQEGTENPQDTEPIDIEPIDTEEPNGTTGVYFEVESIAPVAPWVEETVYDDYSGTSYLRWPDVADNTHGITNNQDAALAYDFSIGTSGTYLVEVRGRRDHEGWCTDAADDACNDVWVQMDDGAWTKKMIKQGTWGDWIWDGKWEPGGSVITTEIELGAGSHTYQISGRSNGVKIDAVRIYLQGTDAPTAP